MLNRMIKWLTNNFGLKILAVVFASVLWLAVVNIDDPKTTRTFTTTVSVENNDYLTEIGKYYEIINNSNTVTFKVSGKRSYLERMGNSDFKAVADLEMIENLERVPIDITPQRYGGYVTVASKINYLELTVEDLVSKPFMISVKTDGKVAKQHAIGETSASPTLIRVSGPASVVNEVNEAVATVGVEGMSQDLTDSVIPVLYDKQGREVDMKDLTYNIQNVLVSVKILDTKDVTLDFQTAGTLPQGYEYVGIEYKPQTVTVKGTSAVLNALNSITVPPEVFDLTNVTGNIEKEVDISAYLPNNVTLVDSDMAKVSVVVKIEKHELRTFKVPTANLTIKNLGQRYDVKFLSDTVDVELEGLSTELDALDASTLTGSIDVSGMMEGEHTVGLELNLDSKFKLAKNATVTVDIIDKDEVLGTLGAGSNSSNSNDSDKTNTEEPDSEKPEDSEEDEDTQEDTKPTAGTVKKPSAGGNQAN